MRFLRLFNWKTILLFAAAGPAVGAVFALLFSFVMAKSAWTLQDFSLAIMGFLFFGYLGGFQPAMVTGVVFSAVQSGLTLQGPRRTIALVAVGAICGTLITGIFSWKMDFTIIIGACSGAVCAVLACRMERRARGKDS
jgi:prepilin signal peptidase PulO-like enzyme (type II secretory pathway)